MSTCILAFPARADECAVLESRSSLATLSGARISSVEIISDRPLLPGPAERLSMLHIASQPSLIRRQVLFAAGDTIDTLLVGETMRRLRSQHIYSDAVLLATRCDPEGPVAVVLRTRDSWTLRPSLRLRTGNQLSVGIEDRNFMGTGRAITVSREMTVRGVGASGALTDPFLFGSNIAGTVRLSNLAGGHTFKVGLRQHDFSVFDGWRSEANFSRMSYGDTIVGERALHTVSGMFLVGRPIARSANGVLIAEMGGLFDSAASVSPTLRPNSSLTGEHVRSFVGLSAGLQRRTAQFDSASWIVPARSFLDVPLGWEGDGIIAGGYERDARTAALKFDGWAGRAFLPSRGQILNLDAWASGYAGHGVDRNQIIRAAAAWYKEALRGMWGVRLTAEQLSEVDPDRRGLSLMPVADYTAPVMRNYSARGGEALAGSVDRDVRLFHVGGASVVNFGGFIAGSYRWDVPDVPNNQLKAGVVGARFRILSANGAISSVRMDIGFPVIRSDILERKPFLVMTYGTLFDVSRQRDGRRVY